MNKVNNLRKHGPIQGDHYPGKYVVIEDVQLADGTFKCNYIKDNGVRVEAKEGAQFTTLPYSVFHSEPVAERIYREAEANADSFVKCFPNDDPAKDVDLELKVEKLTIANSHKGMLCKINENGVLVNATIETATHILYRK